MKSAYALILFSQIAWAGTYPECPDRHNLSEMEAWRKEALKHSKNYAEGESKKFKANLLKCFPEEEVPPCMKNMRNFYFPIHMRIGDEKAFAKAIEEDTPEERKTLPKEFLAEGEPGRWSIPSNIEAIAAEKGWTTVRFKTKSAGGFDLNGPAKSESLLFVYIPGDKTTPPSTFDRFLQLTLPEDPPELREEPVPSNPVPSKADYTEGSKNKKFPNSMAMITAQRGKDGEPGNIVLTSFGRSSTSYHGNFSNITNCFSCHPSGLLPISPMGYRTLPGEKSLPEDVKKKISDLNDIMSGYGKLNWGAGKQRFFIPEEYGPPKGALSPRGEMVTYSGKTIPLDSDEFLNYCMDNAPNEVTYTSLRKDREWKFKKEADLVFDRSRVKKAMNCASCHDGNYRGILNEAISTGMLRYRIFVDHSMPPHLPLNVNEKLALENCLNLRYLYELDAWMLEGSCIQGNAPTSSQPGSGKSGGVK